MVRLRTSALSWNESGRGLCRPFFVPTKGPGYANENMAEHPGARGLRHSGKQPATAAIPAAASVHAGAAARGAAVAGSVSTAARGTAERSVAGVPAAAADDVSAAARGAAVRAAAR